MDLQGSQRVLTSKQHLRCQLPAVPAKCSDLRSQFIRRFQTPDSARDSPAIWEATVLPERPCQQPQVSYSPLHSYLSYLRPPSPAWKLIPQAAALFVLTSSPTKTGRSYETIPKRHLQFSSGCLKPTCSSTKDSLRTPYQARCPCFQAPLAGLHSWEDYK
mmetsp:Transcript_14187/g.25576  ORF Transcript_14187/g.25576 Transcript_14187/m.25576 type:complete len:160 (+) Transcript_14187:384-863(+)